MTQQCSRCLNSRELTLDMDINDTILRADTLLLSEHIQQQRLHVDLGLEVMRVTSAAQGTFSSVPQNRVVSGCLSSRGEIISSSWEGQAALHEACLEGNAPALEILLQRSGEERVDVHTASQQLFVQACASGNMDAV